MDSGDLATEHMCRLEVVSATRGGDASDEWSGDVIQIPDVSPDLSSLPTALGAQQWDWADRVAYEVSFRPANDGLSVEAGGGAEWLVEMCVELYSFAVAQMCLKLPMPCGYLTCDSICRYVKGEGYVLRGRLAVHGHAGVGASIILLRNELPNGAFPVASSPMMDNDMNLVQMTLRAVAGPCNSATGATPSRKKLFE
jgi:hypothetical protein